MIEAHSAFLSMSAIGRLLDVEDLAADRQQAWNSEFRASFGRAERGVALDDEELGLVDVLAAAVRELRGSALGLERVLAALASPCAGAPATRVRMAPTTFSSSCAACPFVGFRSTCSSAVSSVSTTRATMPRDRGGTEDLLRLALELRLGQPDGDDGGEPLEDVVLLDPRVLVAGLELDLLTEDLEQALLEAPPRWVPPSASR
jgi:hypothetical protein